MSSQRIFNLARNKIKSFSATRTTGSGEKNSDLRLSPRAMRQLNRLQLNASRFLPGFAVGQRPSLRSKPSWDFREHRMYVPGDDVRFVDWKASARQEHIFVKLGEHPKEATVYILLDCSGSMGWGEPPKSDTALLLAASLGYLALAQGDRLVIVPMRSIPETSNNPGNQQLATQILGPITGKGQYPHLLNYLRGLSFGGRLDFDQAIHHFTRHLTIGGGLVLVISDLLYIQDLNKTFESFPVPTWDVIVLHLLHPQELIPSIQGDLEMHDIETDEKKNYDITPKALNTYKERLNTWRESLEFACIQNNHFYTLISSEWSIDRDIIPRLRDLNVVKPL